MRVLPLPAKVGSKSPAAPLAHTAASMDMETEVIRTLRNNLPAIIKSTRWNRPVIKNLVNYSSSIPYRFSSVGQEKPPFLEPSKQGFLRIYKSGASRRLNYERTALFEAAAVR